MKSWVKSIHFSQFKHSRLKCSSAREYDRHLCLKSESTLWMSHPCSWCVSDSLWIGKTHDSIYGVWWYVLYVCVSVCEREGLLERGERVRWEVIDSCHSDQLWIICRHLNSWKANSGVISFSTLALKRSQLSFSVCTCKIPLCDTRTSSPNLVLGCSDSKLCACGVN